MKYKLLSLAAIAALSLPSALSLAAAKSELHSQTISDSLIAKQRKNLAANTAGQGFGPQSPRNIDNSAGANPVVFAEAPAYSQMNLCNIHMHKNAEHAGGEFSRYAGNGDGHGYQSGYKYAGQLSPSESKAWAKPVCQGEHGGLEVGDTIEVHYVHSSAQIQPGPTLASCLNDAINNPQLRVEAQVFVLVNDSNALDFVDLTKVKKMEGLYQAPNILNNTGQPVNYLGSTTGPGYNEHGSPFQVSWSVHPKVAKVTIESVGRWCEKNQFNEDHAHGVRNLVTNPELLAKIK
ncbi:delta-class carbonic anhydrase [Agaribacterium haliotis]|uniref:delta-class carbonic anhydrase n=1 Tax=Agaribacterium haliotis TaxID=2013869 RepID=UPI000BB56FC3|nr:delta-class carbonic anhydrase [Agaribacterium haliotis]